jgi:hypothetical protein
MELTARIRENRTGDEPRTKATEEALLAAALVATLVEYRHHTLRGAEHPRLDGVGPNWRMMARLQQLGE